MRIKNVPVAKAEMLIRKPVSEVFEAFVNPEITSKFWFTESSGRLKEGEKITWEWGMYDFSLEVDVKTVEQNKRIVIEWETYDTPTTVEWIFTARADNTTFVSITNRGFSGDGDEIVKQAIDSTEGFAFVLAGLKALFEHDIILNLVSDRFPEGLEDN